MAPQGKHCLHAYLPATEPYHIWKGVKKDRCKLLLFSISCGSSVQEAAMGDAWQCLRSGSCRQHLLCKLPVSPLCFTFVVANHSG